MQPIGARRARHAATIVLTGLVAGAIGVAAFALLGPRSDGELAPTAAAAHGTPGRSTPSPIPTREAARTVPTLPDLPPQGLVVDGSKEVRLYDLDGELLARLPGFTLGHRWAPGRPPMLTDVHGAIYRLDAARGRLRRGALTAADDRAYDRRVTLPRPRYGNRPAAGHWRWAVLSPDGFQTLGQWSGECEVPTAMVLTAAGREPRPVVGATYADAPSSYALGWTADSRPVVHLPQGACGSSHPVPGVYAGGTQLTRLVRVRPWATVQMWGVGGG